MTRTYATKEFHLAALRSEGAAFRQAAGTPGALTADVPSCPDWRVEDLVRHLTKVYAFVRGHVSRGTTSPPERFVKDLPDPPGGDAALPGWEAEHAALTDLLAALDPEMPAWNWAPQPKKAIFWHRRIAHETTVHRWDAQMAVGRGEPVEARLAADGVAEVLDSWLPGGRRLGPTDRLGVAQLEATDIEQQWFVRLRGEGGIALLDTDTLLDTDDPQARVMARGTASDLLLALYGRVPFDILDVTGDTSVLESLRTG